jgi:hypothetical protein
MELSDATEKIPSDTTGDQPRDLPTSSAVPYPLRHPPRAPIPKYYETDKHRMQSLNVKEAVHVVASPLMS